MSRSFRTILTAVGFAFILAAAGAKADNWPQWRGPTFDGSSSETGLPESWSKTNQVAWIVPMPGPAAATPAVWGDAVFVSSTDKQARSLEAICIDRVTGKVRWQHKVADGFGQDDRSNYASPSPATDGKHVWFFYGNGELVCFDLEGKTAWARNIQKDFGSFAFLWTFSSSPALYHGRLYLQVLQRNEAVSGHGRTDGANDSYLLALDAATGKEIWRHVRPSEARSESREAFTTPIPYTHEGREQLLVAGGDCLSAHSLADGSEIWRWGTWNPTRITHWRLVPSPVAGGGTALACAPKGSPVYAIKLGLHGTLDDTAIAWKSADREVSSDVSTPLFYHGRYYILNSDKRSLACVEPATGRVVWNGSLGSKAKVEASPTAGDGKIYVMNQTGDVSVVAVGDEFKLLQTVAMGDEGERDLRSCIALAQGQLFIRTAQKLYCVGAKP